MDILNLHCEASHPGVRRWLRQEQIDGGWSKGGSWSRSPWQNHEQTGKMVLPSGKEALAGSHCQTFFGNGTWKLLGDLMLQVGSRQWVGTG